MSRQASQLATWYVLYDLFGKKVVQDELLRYSACQASCRHRRGAAVPDRRQEKLAERRKGSKRPGTLVVEAVAMDGA